MTNQKISKTDILKINKKLDKIIEKIKVLDKKHYKRITDLSNEFGTMRSNIERLGGQIHSSIQQLELDIYQSYADVIDVKNILKGGVKKEGKIFTNIKNRLENTAKNEPIRQHAELEAANSVNQTHQNEDITTKMNNIPTNDCDIIDKIINEFVESYGDYTVMSRSKERTAAAKLLRRYRNKFPVRSISWAITDLRYYFDLCNRIKDDWYHKNMSLSVIVSKFNEINRIIDSQYAHIDYDHCFSENPFKSPPKNK